MKTAREVLCYCYGHGRIVSGERYIIAMSDLDNQYKQIKALQVENEKLKKAIAETLEDNAHLADGDICTLIKLKTVMQDKE